MVSRAIGHFAWSRRSTQGQADHKVLAVLPDEKTVWDDGVRDVLRSFIEDITAKFPAGSFIVGQLLPKESALDFIEISRDEDG